MDPDSSPQASQLGYMRLVSRLALLLIAVPAVAQPAGAPPFPPPLEIRFLDVGQAEAVLITLGKKAVLVDAGRADDIVLVLSEYGIDTLLAAIASHNHDDHIGGMDAVIADYPIGVYVSNGRAPSNANARAVDRWLVERKVSLRTPPLELAMDDARITLFASTLDPTEASENNSSVGVLIERGSFKALLTGDSEVEELIGWLDAGIIPDVDVLKAAHHGARNGLTPGWLNRTKPEVVVISVGAGNSFGHPDPRALQYYQLHGRRVFRTDVHATVTVRVERDGAYVVESGSGVGGRGSRVDRVTTGQKPRPAVSSVVEIRPGERHDHLSFPRTRESIFPLGPWAPASAGATTHLSFPRTRESIFSLRNTVRPPPRGRGTVSRPRRRTARS